jgi:hypothetical protein
MADGTKRLPFVYKRASTARRAATFCPVYEQPAWAIELLFGSGNFSRVALLDRRGLRAQDHSYTNNKSVVAD